MEKNLHEGHRDRVKKKFLKDGFTEGTPKHEILEMILFYSVPRKDTNELAHKLLEKFGSLSGVLNAPLTELEKFPGITQNTAVLFKMIMETARIYNSEAVSKATIFSSIEEIGTYLLGRFAGITEEQIAVVSLKSNGQFISYDVIGKGDISSVGVSTRKIIEILLQTKATTVIIAHNHPGGVALPSGPDLETTKNINAALKHIGVHLIDHIIIADDDFVSLAQSKQFKDLFD